MEHLFNDEERKSFSQELDTFQWLNFDHDLNEYGLVPIADYPLVRGWSQQNIIRLRTEPTIDPRDLALLQSWLFFGVLETTLGIRVPSRAFLRNTNGKGYVFDTSQLRDILRVMKTRLLEEWRAREILMNAFAACFKSAIQFSAIWNRILINKVRTLPALAEVYDPIIQSSALIGESLYALHEFLLEDAVDAFPDVVWHLTGTIKRDLHGRFARRGWCPSAISAADELRLSALLYVTIYPSEECTTDIKHWACTEAKCLINDIDVASYKPKHAIDCQTDSCCMVTADVTQLKASLRDGKIPIVNAAQIFFGGSRSKKIELPTTSYIPGTLFVAFSHVWAHGRGSAAEQGLPLCQIKFFLNTMIKPNSTLNVYTSYFWIDSLCIPEEKESRAKAIQLIASIYSKASVTVVLDEGMQKLNSSVPQDYFLLRLMLSDWNRRLWTLQEGALSTNIHVLTSSGLVSLQKKALDSLKAPIRTAVSLRISNWSIRFLLKQFRSVLHISLQLTHRSSSKRSDEALAIAPMLDVDPLPLTRLTGDERMAALWKGVREVPRSVLFMGSMERLSTPGYGWAPKTLMTNEGVTDTTDLAKDAIVTDEGLKATYYVLRFKKRVKMPDSTAVAIKAVDAENGLCYFITGPKGTSYKGMYEGMHADAVLVQRNLLAVEAFEPAVSLLSELNGFDEIKATRCLRYKYLAVVSMMVTRINDAGMPMLGMGIMSETIHCEPLNVVEIFVS